MHFLCTICSEIFNQVENIYGTKCGHLFHHHCISQWIERSKTCPQCRNTVTQRGLFRMYPTAAEGAGEDATTVRASLDDALLHLRTQKAQAAAQQRQMQELQAQLDKANEGLKEYEKKLQNKSSAVYALKEQLKYTEVQLRDVQKLKKENEELHKNNDTMKELQKVLNATTAEVEEMLRSYKDVRTVATFATALKRALCESESKKSEMRARLLELKQQLHAHQSRENVQENSWMPAGRSGGSEAGSARKRHAHFDEEPLGAPRGEPARQQYAAKSSALGGPAKGRPPGQADSPYLALRRGSAALAAHTFKPSERMLSAGARHPHMSIFSKTRPPATCKAKGPGP